MILPTIAMAILYGFTVDAVELESKPAGTIYYSAVSDSRAVSFAREHYAPVQVSPLSEKAFQNVVRQQYDYSCGSAALTTLLNGTLATKLQEKEVLNGMLKYGEYEKIISRRSFSLLDMKRYVNTLGFDSGGYKAKLEDIVSMNQPVIVPIDYAGTKHFVVVKGVRDGRVYIADPSVGNISFTVERFKQVWDNNTLFKVGKPNQDGNLLTIQDDDLRHVDDRLVAEIELPQYGLPAIRMDNLRDRYSTVHLVVDDDKKSAHYGEYIYQPLRMYYKRK